MFAIFTARHNAHDKIDRLTSRISLIHFLKHTIALSIDNRAHCSCMIDRLWQTEFCLEFVFGAWLVSVIEAHRTAAARTASHRTAPLATVWTYCSAGGASVLQDDCVRAFTASIHAHERQRNPWQHVSLIGIYRHIKIEFVCDFACDKRSKNPFRCR